MAVLGSILGLALGATPGFGADSGGVDAQVTVSPAAACIELSTASVNFGTLALGAENQAGAPGITITNCGDADASLMASGSNATGQAASWSLVDSAATCADTLGTDNYHLALADTLGAPIATLSTENKAVGTLTAAGSLDQVARISTACPGSSGAGKVMSMSINYVATTIVAPPIVLEPLTADQATADSAAAYLLPSSRNVDVAANCASNPTVACAGGVPGNPPPQVQVQATNVVTTQVPGTTTWNGSATLQAATLQSIPMTYNGISCTVTVDSATSGSPTLSGTYQESFLSYPTPGGQPNYVAIGSVSITGLDSGDVQIGGGFSCSLASTLVTFIIPQLENQISAYIEGNLCGDPGPAVWMACPALP
ncbi:MAG: hypothetical protein HYX55_00665 [Chloroflexi bacterium]|nr:hypothetical protein [Chloroflexota bacterium]